MTAGKIKIAMLLDNNGEHDNRVYIEARALAAKYDLTLFAGKAAHLPENEVRDGIKIKRIFDPEDFKYSNRKNMVKHADEILKQGFNIVHCHDYFMLEVGAAIKRMDARIKLIYDSHEVFHSWPISITQASWVNRIKSLIVWKLKLREERKNAQIVDCLITVNYSVAEILQHYFKMPAAPEVIMTIPYYQPIQPGNNLLRNKLGIPSNSKILVFIGMKIFRSTLNLERVIDEIGNQEGISIVFIGGNDANKIFFEEYVKQNGLKNIYFHSLIPINQIPQYLCDCDVGLVPTWNKKDLSYWYALDNKLFNYISAGIPVLATAQPEYKNLVEKYHIGVCVNPDDSSKVYLDGLKEIIAHYDEYKADAMKAREVLNWEHESVKLLDLYERLINQ